MNIKTRLEQLERRTGIGGTRYVWLDAGKTEGDALARMELSPRPAETMVFFRWMTEFETRLHGHT